MTDLRIHGLGLPDGLGDAAKSQQTPEDGSDFSQLLADSMQKLTELNTRTLEAPVKMTDVIPDGSHDIKQAFKEADQIYRDVMQTRQTMIKAYQNIMGGKK